MQLPCVKDLLKLCFVFNTPIKKTVGSADTLVYALLPVALTKLDLQCHQNDHDIFCVRTVSCLLCSWSPTFWHEALPRAKAYSVIRVACKSSILNVSLSTAQPRDILVKPMISLWNKYPQEAERVHLRCVTFITA